MRIGDFTLENYGPFQHLTLPFDPAPGRVSLVVAPNGFGKSVIRRSIGDFLFGIDARTPMAFRHGTDRMRLLGDVVHDGARRPMVRRKGNGNTLSAAGGADIPPEEAGRLLGGATKTTFQELFGLDTALLRSGGQDLIHTQGRLGQVLFAAGGGMARVRELMTELERKRDELGKATARHKSRPIWAALSNWEQGAADLRRAAMRPDGWDALERGATDAARHLETLSAAQAADSAERDRIRTISACRAWLDRLTTAQTVLAEAADAPDLDPAFEKRWRDALEADGKAAAAAEAAATELQGAQDARAKLCFDPAWIAAEAEISALADLRGLARGAEADLPRIQRDLSAARLRAMALRHDLGHDEAWHLPPAPAVKDAQRRLQLHPKLAAEAASAQDRLTEADTGLNATLTDLEALPGQGDVAAITDLLALLRAGGDPTTRRDNARRKLLQADDALRSALSAIPDCPVTEAALRATAAPSEPELEATGKMLTSAEAAFNSAVEKHDTGLAALGAEQARLAALQAKAKLPAADALSNARAQRDALWGEFCTPVAERPDSKLPGPAAAVALDRAIRHADAVADALITHGKEAAEAAALRDRLATMEAQLANAAQARLTAEATVAQAKSGLLAIARSAGGNAQDMPALRAFLAARKAAVACRDGRDAAAAELAETERELTTLGGQLAEAMGIALPDLAALGTVLAEADRRIKAANDLASRQTVLTEQAATQRNARASAAGGAAKAERVLADWTAEWAPVALALSRPPAEASATTADALARIEELRGVEHEAEDMQRRIDDMQAAIALLSTRIAPLLQLAPDLATALASLPPAAAAEVLQRRLQTEQRDAARCQDADRRIQQAAANLALSQTDAEAAARTLGGLRAALRAATNDEAEYQLQRARTVVAARADVTEALHQLAQQGGGLGIEVLTARASATTAEADAARISEIDAIQRSRIPQIEAARDASQTAAAARDHAGSGMDAAEAAQRREAAQAALARTAEEALVLHAAHALLRTALDRQAAGAEQPLLARIGDVFRVITGGAQGGVHIEETRDGQTMVALEADGTTRKSLDQLSEGTCDQLFLALRVAALEEYATTASPLPFVADDVLQTFDDARAAATLLALLELSHRVQVIVLTHHPHVGDLAARLPQGAVQVLRLDGACAG